MYLPSLNQANYTNPIRRRRKRKKRKFTRNRSKRCLKLVLFRVNRRIINVRWVCLLRSEGKIVASSRRETIAIKNQPVANAKMVGARKATGERDRLYVLPWTLIATIKDFVHVPPVPRTFSRSKCVMSTLWSPLSARFTVTKKNSC